MHARESDNAGVAIAVPPIEIDTLVPCSPGAAFDYFTRDVGRWWPLARYSCSQARARSVAFDGRVGGHLTETDADGKEYVWGTVTDWEPGRKVALTWHPARSPDRAMRVAVTFEAAGASTRVRLVHSGWEALGAEAAEVRDGYANGWPNVLGKVYKGYCEGTA